MKKFENAEGSPDETSAETNVQNGTSASRVDNIVERYATCAKKSAENTIKLAELLVEAHKTLSPMELEDFCKRVGLDREGSTYRKMLVIGGVASRFEPFLVRLPSSWTTLYKLASLEKDKFLQVAGKLAPTMTAEDLTDILEGEDNNSGEKISADLLIDLSKFERSKTLEVCKRVEQLEEEFGFPLKVGKRLANELHPKEKKKKEKPNLRHLLHEAA